ncbi:hypothetical protein ACFQY9_00305 [Microvirga aerilata]|uniref:hypothetical protein n=1 Tax=Microvirga aerilata TaxID=670292 RepID=UPI003628E991
MMIRVSTTALLASALIFMAQHHEAQAQGVMDILRDNAKSATDTAGSLVPSLPSMPVLPEMAEITKLATGTLDEFTEQVSAAAPVLEKLGFEIATFRVQMALPPKAKLRFRSKNVDLDEATISGISATNRGGALSTALISNAVLAKRMQKAMAMGTAVLDVTLGLPQKSKCHS